MQTLWKDYGCHVVHAYSYHVHTVSVHIKMMVFSLYSVCSFVEMARYLLSQKPGLFLLSERFNQDPFFGQQRARGGRSDNPNVKIFLQNAQAIRVQRTMAIGHGGNVRKHKEQWTTDIADLSRSLNKRPRKTLHYGCE